MNETVQDQFATQLKEVNDALRAGRKEGLDMLIPQLKAFMLPAKIKMALATEEEKEIDKTTALFREVWQEINHQTKETLKNTPNAFARVRAYCIEAQNVLNQGDRRTAHSLYQHIRELYPQLDKIQKQKIIPDCNRIVQQLQ